MSLQGIRIVLELTSNFKSIDFKIKNIIKLEG